jgi:hypothetical protein
VLLPVLLLVPPLLLLLLLLGAWPLPWPWLPE